MKKIMFDSNIFDNLGNSIDEITKTKDRDEYYVTTTQIEELCDIPDSKIEIRKINILELAQLRPILVPTAVTILGKARIGMTRLGVGEVYSKVVKDSGKNIDDSIIAQTAVSEGCTLVTNDKELYKKMKDNSYDVMTWLEFLDIIKKH